MQPNPLKESDWVEGRLQSANIASFKKKVGSSSSLNCRRLS